MAIPLVFTLLKAIAWVIILPHVAWTAIQNLGPAKLKYYHAKDSLVLKRKNGKSAVLAELCKSMIPECRLNPFLFNGHLQTVWTQVPGYDVPIYYKRRMFQNEDPNYTGQFAVDFVTKPNSDEDPDLPPRTTYFTEEEWSGIGSLDSRPMLVLLHGLSGGSHESYLRHVLEPLVGEGAGWEACVVTSRGCSKTKLTTSVLYNGRSTWDVTQVVEWLSKTFPNRPLYGIGFSLGGNIMANYLGEQGDKCLLKAAVIMSNPWNLDAGSIALRRTFIGREIYSRTLGSSMKALFETHIDALGKNSNIDVVEVRGITYLHEFDRAVQCPTWGYPTEGAYYRDASSIDSVASIKIPFLAIHAEDDPVTTSEGLPRQEVQCTPYGVLVTTSLGGHLGWFEQDDSRWFSRVTTAFFNTMAFDIDLDNTSMEAANGAPLEGKISREELPPLKTVFVPMRRKWCMPPQ